MKKHLIAFLSMIGFAGSGAPARAQVLKGADENTKTKTESTIKLTNAQKNATNAQNQRKDKWAKANAENKALKNNLQDKANKNETWVKGGKNAAEIKAHKNESELKLKQETLKKQTNAQGEKNALTKAALTKAKGQEGQQKKQ